MANETNQCLHQLLPAVLGEIDKIRVASLCRLAEMFAVPVFRGAQHQRDACCTLTLSDLPDLSLPSSTFVPNWFVCILQASAASAAVWERQQASLYHKSLPSCHNNLLLQSIDTRITRPPHVNQFDAKPAAAGDILIYKSYYPVLYLAFLFSPQC